ncbi:MAG: DUF2190 family protein [Actinomycetota bacterium]
MATNIKYPKGDQIKVASASRSSGDPVAVGQITGVALIDTDADGNITLKRNGSADLSVKGIDGSGNSAVAVGDAIYYVEADTPKLSKKATGVLFGYALGTVGSGQTATIEVLLK